jgi:ATP-dependent DNA helicase PIF1
MSSGRQPQSGIRTLGRDWSQPQSSQPASSSQPIPWSPSPPRPKKPTSLSKEERLRIIQAALDNNPDPAPSSKSAPAPVAKPPPLSTINNHKRPSPSHEHEAPAQKKRALPSSWDAIASSKSVPLKPTKPVKADLSVSGSMGSGSIDPSNRTAKKPAAIFLSKEQSRILQLVQEGNSIFYTGSAGTAFLLPFNAYNVLMLTLPKGTGKSVLLREIIKTLRKKYNSQKSPDAVAVTASTGE